MKILYFTGTGNSLYVAKKIGGDLLSIPQLIKNNQYNIEDDIVGIVCPVYCMTMPNIVKEYLQKVEISANYLFVVMTYGTKFYGCLEPIKRLLTKKGLYVNYSNVVLMTDNFPPIHDIKKEKEKHDNRLIDQKIENIKNDILRRNEYQIPTNLKNKVIEIGYDIIYKVILSHIVRLYINTNICNNCNICRDICPRGNIIMTDEGPVIRKNCEYCFGCYHNCPRGAIHDKGETNNEHYRNQNIKLLELIQSNKQ